MNYLTNYYKNLSEQLQYRANRLENEVRMINEALSSYEGMARRDATGSAPIPAVNRRGVMGMDTGPMSGGAGSPGPFSGAQLGQLLGSGNMNAVNQYLAQYGANGAYQAGPAAYTSSNPSSNRRNRARGAASAGEESDYGVGGQAEGPGQGSGIPGDYNGDGRVDGADLGMALGGGSNTSNVLQNWSLPYSQQGPATLSSGPSVLSNRPRGVYGSDVGPGMPQFGSPQPEGGPGGQPQFGSPNMGGGPATQPVAPGSYSGAQLGQYLASGNMDLANQYLNQYGVGGAYVAGPANYSQSMPRRGRMTPSRGGIRGAGR
jgi:hypothetical protein